MIGAWVELSRENLPLARAELDAALQAMGRSTSEAGAGPSLPSVAVESPAEARRLAARLALARRVIARWKETSSQGIEGRLRREVRAGESVSFRPLDRPTGAVLDPRVRAWAVAIGSVGARIDLEAPDRRFVFRSSEATVGEFGEEVASVDRASFDQRRMPRLPFRRPVSLPPKLGRVAANLARVRPGDRVVDPFLGTGALAIESALLGAGVTGVDTDATMVKGAVANFAHLSLAPEAFVVADAGSEPVRGVYDALVTDPPYGRASTTGGEDSALLAERVVGHWAPAIRPGGRLVVVVPGGPDPVASPWRRILAIPDRVHRSLRREFRVYERVGESESGPRPGDPTTAS